MTWQSVVDGVSAVQGLSVNIIALLDLHQNKNQNIIPNHTYVSTGTIEHNICHQLQEIPISRKFVDFGVFCPPNC
jgi:hypothetical protein